jgi:hypothetical protein
MKQIAYYISIAIAGILIGRYVIQPKQEVKEVVKIVEVERNVKEEKKTVKTRVKEITKKDGTKEVTTDIIENSGSKEVTSKDTKTDAKTISKTGAGVSIGVLALKDLSQFNEQTHVGVVGLVPVLGSLKAVVSGDSSKRVGLGLALEF